MRPESPDQLGNVSCVIPTLGMRRYNGNVRISDLFYPQCHF
uniref:Uncharacterized protein n=1 Tax=Arundo donax TaxID=35708 RepID=A0A0A9GZJ0_ARUDO